MNENFFKKNHKKTAKLMCILMLLSLGLCLVYSEIIKEVRSEQIASIEDIKEEQFTQIYNYLQILEEKSYDDVKIVSSDIEKDINDNIDLVQLKKDMDTNVRNQDLHNILEKNIKGKYLNNINNYRNGIFIVTPDYILEDPSYDRSSTTTRSWRNDIKNSYNSNLKKDAYNKLMNHHTDSLIVIEPVDLMDNSSSHTKVDYMDEQILKDIFMKEGINGLRNYQFLIPAYITENGDVFGQEDIVQGQRTNNHKIIVIQEFNLYDQIMKEYPTMNNNDDLEELQLRYNNTMNWLYILGCLFIICAIVLLIIVSSIYNKFIEDHELLSKEEDYSEESIP